MSTEWVRRYSLTMSHATEQIQWGDHLVYKVGGKIYLILSLEPSLAGNAMSLKVPVEEFAELCEIDGIKPAPYLARASWLALEREDVVPPAEVKRLVKQSYDLVRAKLPKKVQATLDGVQPRPARKRNPRPTS